jgi:KaiC/GvpD/RAD55 family RecA-like ATPase
MPKKESSENTVACTICGAESPVGSKRCEHCYSSLEPGQEEIAVPEGAPETDKNLEQLLQVPGVGEAKAEILYEAGYHTIDDLKKASVEQLSAVKGIGEKLASKIVQEINIMGGPQSQSLANWLSGGQDGLDDWLSGKERSEPEAAAAERDMPRDDSLAKWLSGEESDVNSWLDETRAQEAAPRAIGPNEMLAREAELIQLRETLREKLRQFESGDFDPQAVVEELAKAKGELDLEKAKAKHLEEEFENVKRGSIAVIKFIKSQQGSETDNATLTDKLASEMANRENLELKIMQLEQVVSTLKEKIESKFAEMAPDEQEIKRQELAAVERQAQLEALGKQLLAKEEALSKGVLSMPAVAGGPASAETIQKLEEAARREADLMEKAQSLEAKLASVQVEVKQKDDMLKLTGGKGQIADKDIMRKLEEAQRAERTLAIREQEIQRFRDDLKMRDEEMRKLKEPMKYKEDEMLRREEDLMYRERLLQEELRKVNQAKSELTSQDELTLKKRLEELQAEVTAKEEEVRAKEKYLAIKEEDLRMREQGVITEEIEKREQERLIEFKMEKVKSGTTRLDDLLLGGIPFGANILVYGPPFTGKEVLVSVFIAEGLKKGVPAIWILTEKTPKEIREELQYVVSGYEEYEKLGLVRYVDAYSRSMGDDTQDPYTEYVEAPTDYESIQKAVENAAKKFKEKHQYYRVGFRSISTLIAYLDPGTAFRFLSPVVGRRKRDGAVAMYTIEKGVHGDQEIQMIGSLMDGMIEFKVENLNTFLSVRGICDVQSRAFIRYTSTKANVTIGSFSLDHIR